LSDSIGPLFSTLLGSDTKLPSYFSCGVPLVEV